MNTKGSSKAIASLLHQRAFSTAMLIVCGALLLLLNTIGVASAQDFSGVTSFLETTTTAITGPVGTSVAVLGMCAVGFTFMIGRMDWKFALAIAFGIVIVFSAAAIVGGFPQG